MRSPSSRSGVIAAALAALALAAPAAQAAPGHHHDLHDRLVLSTGHLDLVAPQWDGSALSLSLKDDTRVHDPDPVHRDPEDVLSHVKPEAAVTIPDAPAFAFLGTAGETSYILPQVQNLNLLWPGFSSEHASLAPFAGQTFTWRLVGKDGPGEVALWQSGSFGSVNLRFNTRDGLPDAFSPGGVGTHAHYNWAFSEPGLYTLTFEVTTSGGPTGAATTGEVEYVFFVGDLADLPEDPEEPVVPELSIAGLQSSYVAGETVSLAAVQHPETALDHYHWFRRCGEGPWAVVGGQPTLTFTAAEADDGCEYEVRLYDDDHDVVATSPAVVLQVVAPPAAASTSVEGDASGTVAPTLGLSIAGGASASFGTFLPGLAQAYDTTLAASVTTTGEDTDLTVHDPSADRTGRLVNGAYALASPLQARATTASSTTSAFAPVGGVASPTQLLSYPGPVSADPVTLHLRQEIGATEPLRTGTYGKTLTFTLSTNTP